MKVECDPSLRCGDWMSEKRRTVPHYDNDKAVDEWFLQADFDMETAEAMFRTGRYVYAVFMAHLSLEKTLKGIYQRKLGLMPPKTHNLAYLADKAGLAAPAPVRTFLVQLNEAQIATRYPASLASAQAAYPKPLTRSILERAQEVSKWTRTQP